MNSKRNRIALLFTFTILFILPNWLPASAQSDPTLAGSWVGVYESADHVNLFFVEGNEDGQGYFYTHQSSRPSLIQDLHHDEQQIQFMAGTGDSKLSFAGDRVDDAYVG